MKQEPLAPRDLRRWNLALGTLLLAGCAFLGWRLFAEQGAGAEEGLPRGGARAPSFRYTERADGMPVGEVDGRELTRFLEAFGIPPFRVPPPPMEAGIARSMEAAMRALAQEISAEGYGRLGLIFDALRMTDQTGACFARAVQRAPDEHRWRHLLGRNLVTRGELDQAEREFRRAIELLPSYFPTRWRLAQLRFVQDRVEEARAILLDTLPKCASPYPATELASLEIQAGRLDAARRLLEEALRRDPPNGRAHALMSQVLTALGETEAAAGHARKGRYTIHSLDPIPDPIVREGLRETDSVAYHRVAARAMQLPREEAVAIWERICAADPANADDKVTLANAYFDAGRVQDAISTLEIAIQQKPRGARFRLARAQLAIRMNDLPTALEHAEQALALERAPVAALGVKSLALMAQGRVEEALAAAERALELRPDDPEVYSFLASQYAACGRTGEAIATYRRGLAVDPESQGLSEGLAALERIHAPGSR